MQRSIKHVLQHTTRTWLTLSIEILVTTACFILFALIGLSKEVGIFLTFGISIISVVIGIKIMYAISFPFKGARQSSGNLQSPTKLTTSPSIPPASLFPNRPTLLPGVTLPLSHENIDATRYQCAAGHLDEDFQDYVMRHVIYEERRALGESYGTDMLAVVSWCKAGLKRVNLRDGILTSLLVLAIFGDFLAINWAAGVIKTSIPLTPALIITLIIIILALVMGIAFNVEKWIKRRWPHTHPGFITYLVLLVPCGVFGFIAVPLVWLTIFFELIARYYGRSANSLRKGVFNSQARPAALDSNLEAKLRESFTTVQRNVVIYSGISPFAGAGIYRDGWSFVIDTTRGALDLSSPSTRLIPLPFTLSSLYSEIEKDVSNLGLNDMLKMEGKLYVNGQFLPEKPPFFNNATLRPLTSVDPRFIEYYKENPTEDVRYYQCLRFNIWRGEVIFTVFLRFVHRGKDLFTEVDHLLLPPMKPEYHWADKIGITPPLVKIWELYKRSLDAPIQLWFSAPFRLLRSYFYAAEQRRLVHVARNNPAFDYGASTSLRQEASDDKYHLFFQKLDEEMYFKVVEKQILDTVGNFLNAHQIDTTELRQRQQMVLNNNTLTNNSSTPGIDTRSQVINNSTRTEQGNQPQQVS